MIIKDKNRIYELESVEYNKERKVLDYKFVQTNTEGYYYAWTISVSINNTINKVLDSLNVEIIK